VVLDILVRIVRASAVDPGSWIRCLFLLQDPGWVRSGTGMNIPDHIFESLETIFGLKILEFFDADLDP
jgi:hypothetical protein